MPPFRFCLIVTCTALVLPFALGAPAKKTPSATLSPSDLVAIRSTLERYRGGWRTTLMLSVAHSPKTQFLCPTMVLVRLQEWLQSMSSGGQLAGPKLRSRGLSKPLMKLAATARLDMCGAEVK